jgi:cobalt-zinc-cadmium efflux system membrane fusion protein
MIQPMKNILLYTLIASMLLACNSKQPTNQTVVVEENHQGEAEHTEDGEHQKNGNTVELTAQQVEVAGVVIGEIKQRSLSNVLKVNGLLDVPPQSFASVSIPLGGFVKKTDLLPGTRVKKGQVIAMVENPEFIEIQQEYLESVSQLEYLRQEFERQQELLSENVASAKNFQKVKADYNAMQARVGGLRERLKLIGVNPTKLSSNNLSKTVPVYSPITGYVTNVNVNIGKYVQPMDVMFTIANTEHLHVELTVFERDLSKIKKGQKVRFTLPNENATERIATVYLIGREVSRERTVKVHAHLDEEDMALTPGVFVSALIETESQTVPALPNEAIVQTEGKDYVFLYQGSRKEGDRQMYDYQMVQVQRGVVEEGYSAVNLPDSITTSKAQVVLEGSYSLLGKLKNSEEEGHGH